jgi:hypothetical protein
MQPDTIPPVSCCGEADAYWADQVRVGPNGEIIAAITDDREDGPLRRMHEDIGNKYIVPLNKIIKKDVNPTGHAISSELLQIWLEVTQTGPLLRAVRCDRPAFVRGIRCRSP